MKVAMVGLDSMGATMVRRLIGGSHECVVFDHIGYPGPVVHNRPLREPAHLGKGWLKFKFQRGFVGKPVLIINDAATQTLGSYQGKHMLFLGLGTGLGSAMGADGVVEVMELAHLPWKKDTTYEDFLGAAALKKQGNKRRSKTVLEAVADPQAAMEADYVVLGGGNAKLIGKLPSHISWAPMLTPSRAESGSGSITQRDYLRHLDRE